MEIASFVIFLVIGYIIYKIYKSTKRPSQKPPVSRQPMNRGKQRPHRSSAVPNQSLMKSAQKQVSRGNFDEASNLYLRAGQVFTSAKMKMFKGPTSADETLELIRVNAPQRFDVILDNLVNEFYYRLSRPEISTALLRSAGYLERAEAIEVASGISAPVIVNTPAKTVMKTVVKTAPKSSAATPVKKELNFEDDSITPVDGKDIDSFLDSSLKSTKVKKVEKRTDIPNTLLMASADLKDPCIVCRKRIKSGDNFIYCLNCGRAGHYKDLGEMMKVRGKCPSCKERLVRSMYEI